MYLLVLVLDGDEVLEILGELDVVDSYRKEVFDGHNYYILQRSKSRILP